MHKTSAPAYSYRVRNFAVTFLRGGVEMGEDIDDLIYGDTETIPSER